jgi:hypothetical protein
MNWDNFPKGSLNPEYDSLSFGLTGRDLSAAMYLDGDITLLEYRQGIDNNSIIFETQALNEFDMGDMRNILVDIVQLAAGVSADVSSVITGPGGPAIESTVDTIVAIDTAAQATEAIASVVQGAGEIGNIIEGIMKINLESGLDGIYAAVQQVLRAATRGFDFAKKGLEAAKQQLEKFVDLLKKQILKLLSTAIRAVSKWISAIIPTDAGAVGIVLQRVIEEAIEALSENIYDLLKGTINKIPDMARELIFSSKKLGRFMHKIINFLIDLVADVIKERKEKGLIGKAIDVAKAVTNPLLALATSDAALLKVRNFLIKSIKPKIPMAVKAARLTFTLFFGAVAALQVIMREDFLSDDMKKTVAMQTVAMSPDEAPTVAMPRLANENINKWMEYDPTAEKPQQVIPVREMIVIKGDERWGVRAAIKNVSEGRRSRSAGEPIQVTWILAENKFLITDGYHRLVEGMIKGKEEFLCEVDWSGCSLDWKVPRADNRFIMEALKKLS